MPKSYVLPTADRLEYPHLPECELIMNLSAEVNRLAEQSLRVGWAAVLCFCLLAVFSIAVGIDSGAALAYGKTERNDEFDELL